MISDDEKEMIFKTTLINDRINEQLKVQLLYKTLVSLNFKIDQSIADLSIVFCVNILRAASKTLNDENNTLKIIYSSRIIGNLLGYHESANQSFVEYLTKENVSICDLINGLLFSVENHVVKELFWMIGNLHSSSNSVVQNYLNLDNLVGNLKIPKDFQFEM